MPAMPRVPTCIIDSLATLRECVGRQVGTSDWFTVTQERITAFAAASEDRQWIHLDAERAQHDSPYHATIAHGFQTLSLVSHLHAQAVDIRAGQKMLINYGLNRVRFPSAVPAGARIRLHSTLQRMEELEAAVQLTWSIQVEVEGSEKPALVAEWLVRLYV